MDNLIICAFIKFVYNIFHDLFVIEIIDTLVVTGRTQENEKYSCYESHTKDRNSNLMV